MNPSDLTTVDAVALAVIAAFAILGLVKGAIRKVVGLAFLVVAIGVAGRYGPHLGVEAWPIVRDTPDPAGTGRAVGAGLLFLGVTTVGIVVGLGLRGLARTAQLGPYDRTVGLLLGAAQGFVLSSAVAIGVLANDDADLAEGVRESHLYDAMRWSVVHLEGVMPVEFDAWLRDVLDLAA